MKKVFCMIALAAISFSAVYAGVPATNHTKAAADTVVKVKQKKNGVKKKKVRIKKDTTATHM
jgi:hypothetical protein